MNGGRYPQAYIDYLVQFQAKRDYFECHEILEDYWKEHPNSRYRETWVMLIQLAVSLYHQRRGNMRGAVKLMTGALHRYDANHMHELGADGDKLQAMMQERLQEMTMSAQKLFEDLNIPIVDQSLVERCEQEAMRLGCRWGEKSDMADEYLLNRHLLRDREAARQERQSELEKRRRQ